MRFFFSENGPKLKIQVQFLFSVFWFLWTIGYKKIQYRQKSLLGLISLLTKYISIVTILHKSVINVSVFRIDLIYSHLWNSSAARTLILANFSIEYRLILHTTVISFSIIPQQHSYLNHNFNSSGQRISTVGVIFENVSTQHYYSAVYYYLLSEISKKHPYYLTHYYLVNESM